ncbi:hypothetical protein TWF694_009175 [Orbilia ellipsospora]|uniref:Ankyrin repeat protein n=1 Tax=Orbilia ellipsospora TaxID=2528407 RepID=A0AAV9XGW2_9PEZI
MFDIIYRAKRANSAFHSQDVAQSQRTSQWSWSYRFARMHKNTHLVTSLLREAFGSLNQATIRFAALEAYMKLCSNFFEWTEVNFSEECSSAREAPISLVIRCKLYGSSEMPQPRGWFLRTLWMFLRELWASELRSLNFETASDIVSFSLASISSTARDDIKRAIYQFSKRISDHRAIAILQSQDEFNILSYPLTGDHIPLVWCLGIQKKSVHRTLCGRLMSQASNLSELQLLSLLRVAAHCDFYDIAEFVLASNPNLQVLPEIISEATWFSGLKTFNLILEHYNKNKINLSQCCDDEDLKYPLLAAVVFGQLYKVIELANHVNLDVHFAGKTALEVAVRLGRLDITKVLLEAGTKTSLDSARHIALERGNFPIANLIANTIQTRAQYRDENSKLAKHLTPFEISVFPQTPEFEVGEIPEDLLFNFDEYSLEAFSAWTFPGDDRGHV